MINATLPRLVLTIVLMLTCTSTSLASTRAPFTVLVFGDSLSAAYGMAPEQGWVALLREELEPRKVEVVNLSVSGETTAGGLRRLPDALSSVSPDLVVLQLGANDGLRGLDTLAMAENLTRMIELSHAADARVLLLGMQLPPNYGLDYTEAFAAVYAELAERHGVALLPFFLEPVAEDWNLVQDDGLHPTVEAQPLLLGHVRPALDALLPEGHKLATGG